MTAATLQRASKGAQLLGGLLFAALGLRVMTLAISDARARRAPVQLASGQSAPGGAGPSVPPARARHVPAPERNGAVSGAPLRLMLSVVAGPERSEVFVNGSRLGLSPYLGDYTCKAGEPLRIEVVPAHQGLITRSATCEGRTLLIR
jgi:hypothetical protein